MYVLTIFVEDEELPMVRQDLAEIKSIVGENSTIFRLFSASLQQAESDGPLTDED